MTTFLILSALLVLLAVISPGHCLQCFQCEPTEEHGLCDKNFGALRECDFNAFEQWINSKSISKTTLTRTLEFTPKCTKISMSSQGETGYFRTCMPDSPIFCNVMREALSRDPETKNHGIDIQCHYCDTDACNSASVTKLTPLFGAVLVFLAKLLS